MPFLSLDGDALMTASAPVMLAVMSGVSEDGYGVWLLSGVMRK